MAGWIWKPKPKPNIQTRWSNRKAATISRGAHLPVCLQRQTSFYGNFEQPPPPHLWTQLPYMGVEEWWALWKVSHWRHPPGITLNTNKFLATGLERWLNRKELQLLLQRPWVQVPAPTC